MQENQKRYKFTFDNKTVFVTNIDNSSNTVSKNERDLGQTLFDNICDTKVFSEENLNELEVISHKDFMSFFEEVSEENN